MNKTYTIGQVCEILDVKQHTLRYLEKVLGFDISRDPLSNRSYSESDLENLREVKKLKDQGLTYKSIKEKMDAKQITNAINEVATTALSDSLEIPELGIENFRKFMKDLIKESIRDELSSESLKITNKLETITNQNENLHAEIIKQNNELKAELERAQLQHFKEIDEKIAAALESKKTIKKEKNLFKRLLTKIKSKNR